MTDQITRCPNCDTSFVVSAAQLAAADGAVRCGSCLAVFMAKDYFVEAPIADLFAEVDAEREAEMAAGPGETTEPFELQGDAAEALQAEQSERLDDADAGGEESSTGKESSTDKESSTGEESSTGKESSTNEESLTGNESPSDQAAPERSPWQPEDPKLSEDTTSEAQDNHPHQEDVDSAQQDAQPADDLPGDAAAPSSDALSSSDVISSSNSETDFTADWADESQPTFGEELDQALDNLTEESAEDLLPDQEAKSSSGGLAWFVAACLFAGSLAIQYLWFERDHYAAQSQYRGYYEKACNALGCELDPFSDVTLLRTRSVLVRPHPNVESALVVDALLRNEAPFRQPFPGLYLRFSDAEDRTVGERTLLPNTYLAGEMAGLVYIPALTEVRLSLEIVAPGDGVGYSLVAVANP